jgi:hypothetical protein
MDSKSSPFVKKLAAQMRKGCQKPICFNKYCKKYVLGDQQYDTKSDAELQSLSEFVVKKTHDANELICVEAVLHDEKQSKKKVPFRDLNYLNNVSPVFVIQSLEWFCCSFVKDDAKETQPD